MAPNSTPGGAARPDPSGRRTFGSRAASVIRRRPVTAFLLLAFAGMWIPLTATLVLDLPLRLTSAVGAILGLTVPALLVTDVVHGRAAVRSLLRRTLRPTSRPLVFAIALIAIPVTTVALSLLVPGGERSTQAVPQVTARFTLDLVVALLTIQVAEEVGWTGLTQDMLQQRHGPLRAAALIAPAFAAIHLPTYLVGAPVTPATLVGSTIQLVPITVFAVAFRVLIAWSYNASGRCVLAAAVMHASFNTTSGKQFLEHLGSDTVTALLPLVAVALLAATVTLATRRTPVPSRAQPRSPSIVRHEHFT